MNTKSVVKRCVRAAEVVAPELGEVGVDQMPVEARLHVGLDPRHDPIGQDRHAVDREPLDGRDRDHGDRPEHDGLRVLGLERLEGELDQDRVKAGGAADDGDHDEHEGERPGVRTHPVRHRRRTSGPVSFRPVTVPSAIADLRSFGPLGPRPIARASRPRNASPSARRRHRPTPFQARLLQAKGRLRRRGRFPLEDA